MFFSFTQLGIVELIEHWVGMDAALSVLLRVEPSIWEACHSVQQSLKQSLECGVLPEVIK